MLCEVTPVTELKCSTTLKRQECPKEMGLQTPLFLQFKELRPLGVDLTGFGGWGRFVLF